MILWLWRSNLNSHHIMQVPSCDCYCYCWKSAEKYEIRLPFYSTLLIIFSLSCVWLSFRQWWVMRYSTRSTNGNIFLSRWHLVTHCLQACSYLFQAQTERHRAPLVPQLTLTLKIQRSKQVSIWCLNLYICVWFLLFFINIVRMMHFFFYSKLLM